MKPKKKVGLILIFGGMILILFSFYFKSQIANNIVDLLKFLRTILLITGILVVLPYKKIPNYIFDNLEYESNTDIKTLIRKLRLRAILLNNLSTLILFVVLIVIVTGFYLLINPPLKGNDVSQLYDGISIRLGATVLLIFLVQILFRVFKYLLRIAAFYNAKSDSLELFLIKPELQLDQLMKQMTPDNYDISDLPQNSISDNLLELIKNKK